MGGRSTRSKQYALIYGAGGQIGAAVAGAFAREGASVFLAGRTLTTLDAVAGEIEAAGGTAATAHFDALDEQAIEEHVRSRRQGGEHRRFHQRGLARRRTDDEPGGRARTARHPRGLPPVGRASGDLAGQTEEAKQFADLNEFHELLAGRTLLRRLPTLAEVANVAAFMASDQASAMTGTVANLTCGSIAE